MKIRSFLISCFSLFAIASYAQQTEVKLTLQQAVDLAKKNNYTLLNSKLDQEIAVKKVNETLSAGLPQINASGSFNDYINLPTQAVDAHSFPGGNSLPANVPAYLALKFGLPYSAVGGISASQLIFDGTYILGIKAAKEYVNLARLGVRRTETEISAGVSKMYYAALITQANVKMLDNTMISLEKTLKDQRAYYKNGLSEKIDIDRLELGYSNTQIQRDKIADQYTLAVLALKLQLGLNTNDSIVLTDDLEKLYTSIAMVPVDTKIDYKMRPDYQLLEQQMILQTYDIKRYQYGYGPTLNASFTAQRTAYGPDIKSLGARLPGLPASPATPSSPATPASPITQTWFPTTIFSLNLNLPIFDGFRKSTQIQQSKLAMKKFENDKKNLENNIENDVQQSKLKFERSKQQLDIQKKNMDLAQEIYNRADIKYKNGVGSSLELSTSENDMKQAQTNYLSSLYDMLVAQTDLKKALGLLN